MDEFAGIEEIRTVQQSVLRGGSKFVVFKSFNPPITNANWANQYVNEPRADALRHKSDYTTVPREWLGQQFIDDAEHLKETNLKAYQHEYLGIPVGLGTNIFEFLEIRKITDEEIKGFDRIYQGAWTGDFIQMLMLLPECITTTIKKKYIYLTSIIATNKAIQRPGNGFLIKGMMIIQSYATAQNLNLWLIIEIWKYLQGKL